MGFRRTTIFESIEKEKGISVKISETVVQDFLAALMDRVSSGENIQLRGFGTFYRKELKMKKVWDPPTKSLKMRKKRVKIAFKPGKVWTEQAEKKFNHLTEGD